MGWGWQQAIAPEGQAVAGATRGGAGLAVFAACVLHTHHGPLMTHSTPDLPELQSCRPPLWSSPGSLGCMPFRRHMTKKGCIPKYMANTTMPLGITPLSKVAPVPITHAAFVTWLLLLTLRPRKETGSNDARG